MVANACGCSSFNSESQPVVSCDKAQPPESLTFTFHCTRGAHLFPDRRCLTRLPFFKVYISYLAGGLRSGTRRLLLFKLNGTKTPEMDPIDFDKSQQVSFGNSPWTFQTHIEVLRLYFRLQDRFYTHHWVFFCHFFMENKNLFIVQKMFASMSVQKSCYFILFLFWMLYIMKFFRFGILRSPLQPVSYIYKLLENKTKKQRKKREQQKIRYEPFFVSVPPGFQ